MSALFDFSSELAISSVISLSRSLSIPDMASASPRVDASSADAFFLSAPPVCASSSTYSISSWRKNVLLMIRRLIGTFRWTLRSSHCWSDSRYPSLLSPVDLIPRSRHASRSSILVSESMPSQSIRWSSSRSPRVLCRSWNRNRLSFPYGGIDMYLHMLISCILSMWSSVRLSEKYWLNWMMTSGGNGSPFRALSRNSRKSAADASCASARVSSLELSLSIAASTFFCATFFCSLASSFSVLQCCDGGVSALARKSEWWKFH